MCRLIVCFMLSAICLSLAATPAQSGDLGSCVPRISSCAPRVRSCLTPKFPVCLRPKCCLQSRCCPQSRCHTCCRKPSSCPKPAKAAKAPKPQKIVVEMERPRMVQQAMVARTVMVPQTRTIMVPQTQTVMVPRTVYGYQSATRTSLSSLTSRDLQRLAAAIRSETGGKAASPSKSETSDDMEKRFAKIDELLKTLEKTITNHEGRLRNLESCKQ